VTADAAGTTDEKREVEALSAHPYDADVELSLPAASPARALLYEGDVPAEILAIVRRRRGDLR
jgi:hypothetical protein